jgi:phage tail sheath protein FI
MSPIKAVRLDAATIVADFPQGPKGVATHVTSLAAHQGIFGATGEGSLAAVQFFSNGGQEAWILRATDGDLKATLDAQTSPHQTSLGRFGCLLIPATARLDDTAARGIWTAALALCRQQNALLIADPPVSANDTKSILQWTADHADLLHDARVAVYYPRLIGPKSVGEMVTSGAIAGLMARTDLARGVWKAAAGTDATIRGGEPSRTVTDAEQQQLTAAGINTIRQFPSVGTVCWGARTLEGGEWKYVPVRRLADLLSVSISAGLQSAVFEPNGPALWAEVTRTVSDFLQSLWRLGAFQGASVRDAYFIKCDASTTTQADIDQGFFNVMVGFAPLKPAEFVVLKFHSAALAE